MAANLNGININISAQDLASVVIQNIINNINNVNNAANGSAGAFDRLRQNIVALNAGVGLIQQVYSSVASLVVPAVNAALAFEKINIQMKMVAGSQELASRELQFVREEADRLGLSLPIAQQQFAKLSIATRGTSMEGETTRKVFSGLMTTFRAVGLSGDAIQRAFLQINQGINKGKIQLEDMNILAEAGIPIYEMLAKAMGKTKPEIMAMISQGTLLASQVYPALAEAASQQFGPAAKEAASGAAAEMERFKTAVHDAQKDVGEKLIPSIVRLIPAAKGVTEAIGFIASGWAELLGLMTTETVHGGQVMRTTLGKTVDWVVSRFTVGIQAVVVAATAMVDMAGIVYDAWNSQGKMLFSPEYRAEIKKRIEAMTSQVKTSLQDAVDEAEKGNTKQVNSSKVSEKELAEERTRNAERRKKESSLTIEELSKHEIAYLKTTRGVMGEITAGYKKKYDDERKAVKDKYDAMLQTVEKGSTAEKDMKIMFAAELADIDRRHAKDSELIKLDYAEKMIAHEKFAADGQIAEVKRKVENHEITEQAGADAILAIETALLQKQLVIAKERMAILKKTAPNSEAYGKAIDEIAKLETGLTNKITENIKLREKNKKESLDLQTSAAQIAADQQMLSLASSTAANLANEKEAAIKSLQIQKDALNQKIKLAKEAYDQMPDSDPKEKQAALEKILQMEIQAAEKTKAINQQEYANKTQLIENEKNAQSSAASHEIAQVNLAVAQGTMTRQAAADKINQIEIDLANKKVASLARQLDATMVTYGQESAQYQKLAQEKLAAEDELAAKKQAVLTATKEAETAAAQATSKAFSDYYTAVLQGAANAVKGLSIEAENAFAKLQGWATTATNEMDGLKSSLDATKQQLVALYTNLQMDPITRWLVDTNTAALEIREAFLTSKIAATELGDALALPVNKTFEFMKNAEAATLNMQYLDKSSLDKLKGQIDAVKNAMLAFTDKIREALKSLQDEWDNMTMSKLELEEKRYQEQKTKWQADYNEAQRQGNKEALAALAQQVTLIDQIHAKKEAEINAVAPIKRNFGGWIPGIGSSDTVPAMLTPGEYVIRKAAVSHWGIGLMERLNNMMPVMPALQFATGGMVPDFNVQNSQTAPAGQTSQTFNFVLQKLDEATVRREVIPVLERYSRQMA